jgi:predicted LPLAT superfamily acyltransferase
MDQAILFTTLTLLTESSDGIIPEDGGARVVFVIIGAAILGLYFLLRRTRRRAMDDYWSRTKREQELRDADPDLRRDE